MMTLVRHPHRWRNLIRFILGKTGADVQLALRPASLLWASRLINGNSTLQPTSRTGQWRSLASLCRFNCWPNKAMPNLTVPRATLSGSSKRRWQGFPAPTYFGSTSIWQAATGRYAVIAMCKIGWPGVEQTTLSLDTFRRDCWPKNRVPVVSRP